jgi:hypothetical protein
MKIKYILWSLAAIVLALLLIILLPIDAELDADAAAWAERANDMEDVPGNGYYYLMGIMAAPDEDPETVGKAIVAAYHQTLQKFMRGEITEFEEEYPVRNPLPEPEGDYYCRTGEAGCFARLAANPATLRAELKTHAVLLQRYERYLQFDTVKFLVEPIIYERFPPYHYLARGNRLALFRILLESKAGNRERALSMLHAHIEELRRQLAGSSSLISKMIMVAMLADSLDLLFNIAQPAGEPRLVPELTPQELSLELPMIREFGYIVNFHQKEQYARTMVESSDDYDYDWVILTLTRPNMSINSLFPYYRDIAALSRLEASEISSRLDAGEPEVDTEFKLRNVGGWILNSVASLDLGEYITRVHDLNCKIALINAALKLNLPQWNAILQGKAELQAVNPYYPEELPYVDEEAQAVCFDGPYDDERKRRCIRKDRSS